MQLATYGIGYFNTSHVSINPGRSRKRLPLQLISIHLMFLLIVGATIPEPFVFNISIHLMFLLIV